MKTIKVTTPEMLEKVLQLRNEVFVNEQKVDPALENDEYDTLDNPIVDHFALVIKENTVIGTCRCLHSEPHSIRLGRFAIHQSVRHQGFGLKFLKSIHNYYYQHKIENIIIHAQKQACSFYYTAGYRPFGEEYLEANIVHIKMKQTLFHTFYTRFASVYEEIFPLNKMKKELITQFTQNKKSIFDIGCATGEAVKFIQTLNKEAYGIDLNSTMVQIARDQKLPVDVMDLKNIGTLNRTFDGLICIGNVLVHLSNTQEINQFFADAYQLLNSKGQLFIQIINYHKILEQSITSLPTLKNQTNDNSLERNYQLIDNYIHFISTLTISKKQYTDTTILYPLRYTELIRIAKNHRFTVHAQFGGFDQSAFKPDESMQYLVILTKNN